MENQELSKNTPAGIVKRRSIFKEYAKSILVALILAMFIRTFVVQAFEIPSGSMEDTLLIGDRLLVSKFIYGIKIPFTDKRMLKIRNPRRGDVIVFEYPKDRSKDFIKRVIGIPGDRIQIKNKRVYVNGILYTNLHAIYRDPSIIPGAVSVRDNTDMITVPAGSYFVMGDNRDNSYDSRFWGFVNSNEIKGLALIKYWSWDNGASWIRWRDIGQVID